MKFTRLSNTTLHTQIYVSRLIINLYEGQVTPWLAQSNPTSLSTVIGNVSHCKRKKYKKMKIVYKRGLHCLGFLYRCPCENVCPCTPNYTT